MGEIMPGTVTNTTTNTTYATIQEAIDTATASDVINVGVGNYTENLTINKQLTFTGAEAGVSGTGSRSGGESTITGTATISASGVYLDGLSFAALTTGEPAINANSANTTIKNSVFQNSTNSAVNGVIVNSTGFEFKANAVNGFSAGLYVNGGATGDISGNSFTGDDSGAVLDSAGSSSITIYLPDLPVLTLLRMLGQGSPRRA